MLHYSLSASSAVLRRIRHGFPAAELPALDAALSTMDRAACHLRPTGDPQMDAFGPGPAPLALRHELDLAHLQLELLRKLDTTHGASATLERRDACREALAVIRETAELLRSLEPLRRSA